ncbi:MAG: YceD family protein [Acholeplasmataceae bacterium]
MKIYLWQVQDQALLTETIDFSTQIKNQIDIISIKPTKVTGSFQLQADDVLSTLHVSTTLDMACAKTLKPVKVSLDFELDLIFGSSDDADYPLLFPLELDDIIFGHILLEKPYTVYHPDADDISFEEERSPHPAFKDLDKDS